MADFLNDAELGAAGAFDLASEKEASILNWAGSIFGVETHAEGTHYAAEVFAGQTAVDPREQQRLYEAAAGAERGGALDQAAHATVNQIAEGWSSTTKILLGVGVAAVGLVLVVKLS